MRKTFNFYFHYLGLAHGFQLGFHFFPPGPNVELHIPFGFIKIGWDSLREWETYRHVKTIGYMSHQWGIVRYDNDQ
jgi:hypothetical protein